MFRDYLLSLSRSTKRGLLLITDAVAIITAIWLSFAIRADQYFMPFISDVTPYISSKDYLIINALAIVITIPLLIYARLYRSIIRYISLETYKKITVVSFFSAVIWITIVYSNYLIPRSIYLMYFILSTFIFYTSRFVARNLLSEHITLSRDRILIYGSDKYASDIGSLMKNDVTLKPAGFITNDKELKNTSICELPVIHLDNLKSFISRKNIKEILIASSNPSSEQLRKITQELNPFEVTLRILPDLNLITQGKLKVSDAKKIDIDDLLGRDSIEPDNYLIKLCIYDKTVMITGCGGSIGSELSRQIVKLKPKKIILLEQSEYFLYEIDLEIRSIIRTNKLTVEVETHLGSVQDKQFVKNIFDNNKINTVYHAAAHKHVPLVEDNPLTAVQTNILGTYVVATESFNTNVDNFVLVSSDKAVRPTNIMGATKRFSEIILQAFQDKVDESESKKYSTKFSMVRFGNVLDTSGSVVPLFRKQIASGGPVTVTDPNVMRYFMTIKEATELVIQAGSLSKGGDVFLLEMGSPINILDLAKQMIKLSGKQIKDTFNPNGDIEIEFTGLRPGEKLYEELLIGDDVQKTSHQHIMTANEEKLSFSTVESFMEKFQNLDAFCTKNSIQKILFNAVSGYNPDSNKVIKLKK